jgi:hypothetical protein
MATQTELAAAMRHLSTNANWRHYVDTLEAKFNAQVKALIFEPDPIKVEALRGECRALYNLLHNINTNSGGLTS